MSNQSITQSLIEPKADLRTLVSPEKRKKDFFFFAFSLFTSKKSNPFVCFLGESAGRQSCFGFYLTYSTVTKCVQKC